MHADGERTAAWAAAQANAAARASDPTSVLAALLAESPEATVAAIEALLTSDEAIKAAARATLFANRGIRVPWDEAERFVRDWCLRAAGAALPAACRSLLSKAPKEDRDA